MHLCMQDIASSKPKDLNPTARILARSVHDCTKYLLCQHETTKTINNPDAIDYVLGIDHPGCSPHNPASFPIPYGTIIIVMPEDVCNAHFDQPTGVYIQGATSSVGDVEGGFLHDEEGMPMLYTHNYTRLEFIRVAEGGLLAMDPRRTLALYPRMGNRKNQWSLRGSMRLAVAGKPRYTWVHMFLEGHIDDVRKKNSKSGIPTPVAIYGGQRTVRDADSPGLRRIGHAFFMEPGDDRTNWFRQFIHAQLGWYAERVLVSLRMYAGLDLASITLPFLTKNEIELRPTNAAGDDELTHNQDRDPRMLNPVLSRDDYELYFKVKDDPTLAQPDDCDPDDIGDTVDRTVRYNLDNTSDDRIRAGRMATWMDVGEEQVLHNNLLNMVRALSNAPHHFPASEFIINTEHLTPALLDATQLALVMCGTPKDVMHYEATGKVVAGEHRPLGLRDAADAMAEVEAAIIGLIINFLAQAAVVPVNTRRLDEKTSKQFVRPIRQLDDTGTPVNTFRGASLRDFQSAHTMFERFLGDLHHADHCVGGISLKQHFGQAPFTRPTHPAPPQRPNQLSKITFSRKINAMVRWDTRTYRPPMRLPGDTTARPTYGRRQAYLGSAEEKGCLPMVYTTLVTSVTVQVPATVLASAIIVAYLSSPRPTNALAGKRFFHLKVHTLATVQDTSDQVIGSAMRNIAADNATDISTDTMVAVCTYCGKSTTVTCLNTQPNEPIILCSDECRSAHRNVYGTDDHADNATEPQSNSPGRSMGSGLPTANASTSTGTTPQEPRCDTSTWIQSWQEHTPGVPPVTRVAISSHDNTTVTENDANPPGADNAERSSTQPGSSGDGTETASLYVASGSADEKAMTDKRCESLPVKVHSSRGVDFWNPTTKVTREVGQRDKKTPDPARLDTGASEEHDASVTACVVSSPLGRPCDAAVSVAPLPIDLPITSLAANSAPTAAAASAPPTEPDHAMPGTGAAASDSAGAADDPVPPAAKVPRVGDNVASSQRPGSSLTQDTIGADGDKIDNDPGGEQDQAEQAPCPPVNASKGPRKTLLSGKKGNFAMPMTALDVRFLFPTGMILRTALYADIVTTLGDLALHNLSTYGPPRDTRRTKRQKKFKLIAAPCDDEQYKCRIVKDEDVAHTPLEKEYEFIFANLHKLRRLFLADDRVGGSGGQASNYGGNFFFPVTISICLPDTMDAPSPLDVEPEEQSPMKAYKEGGSALTETAIIESLSPSTDFLAALTHGNAPVTRTLRTKWETCVTIEAKLAERRSRCTKQCRDATPRPPPLNTTVFPNDLATYDIFRRCSPCICGSMFLETGSDCDARASAEVDKHRAQSDKLLVVTPFPWNTDVSLYQQTLVPMASPLIEPHAIDLQCNDGLSTSLLKNGTTPKAKAKPRQGHLQWGDGNHKQRIIQDFSEACPADNPDLYNRDAFERGSFDPGREDGSSPPECSRLKFDSTGREGYHNWLDYYQKRRNKVRAILDAGKEPHFSSMGWCQRGWDKASVESDDAGLWVANPMRDGKYLLPLTSNPESDSDYLPEDNPTAESTAPRARLTMAMESELRPSSHDRAQAFLSHPPLHGDDQAVGFLVDPYRGDPPGQARHDPRQVSLLPPVDVNAAANRAHRRASRGAERSRSANPLDLDAIGSPDPVPAGMYGPAPPPTIDEERRVDRIAREFRRRRDNQRDELDDHNRWLQTNLNRPASQPVRRPGHRFPYRPIPRAKSRPLP